MDSEALTEAACVAEQRCDRTHDHRPHGPYVRPGSEQEYTCPGGPPDALTAVALVAEKVVESRRELDAAVRRARREGCAYAAIGAVLGVSRQAAWERFHDLEEKAS